MQGHKTNVIFGSIFIIIVIAIIAWLSLRQSSLPMASMNPQNSQPSFVATDTETTITTRSGTTFSQGDYALATTSASIRVRSYIPPCDDGFTYCIYKNDAEFSGTNFESAGIAITDRTDLANQNACLNTPPEGFDSSLKPATIDTDENGYATSVFTKVGGAAAGHFASGTDYRLWNASNSTCTEFMERVGQSDFANYPPGKINQFTSADEDTVDSELNTILSSVTINSASVVWPPVSNSIQED